MTIKTQLHSDTEILDDIDLARWIAENLPIKFIGDEVLKQKCIPFRDDEFAGEEMIKISQALVETLRKYRAKAGMGRGLAANQIGIPRRMIAVWLGDEPEVFVNPEVISTDGEGSYWESCISAGTLLIGEVIRPWKGVFAYRDLNGGTHTIKVDEKQTRLFFHEIDHLDGLNCLEAYKPGTVKFVRGGKDEILNYPLTKIK
jgi:peptide deformylase